MLFSISASGCWYIFAASAGMCLIGVHAFVRKAQKARRYGQVPQRLGPAYHVASVIPLLQVADLVLQADDVPAAPLRTSAVLLVLPVALYPIAGRVAASYDAKERRMADGIRPDRFTAIWAGTLALLILLVLTFPLL
ncbi:hypothetical protein [Streptomyces sp. WM6386]|uniref:hypothetical protein n=1 Tax=Streptomyces sp. WM6386 TaxID=1415558 RepID=UPI0006190612|nr:hypothetical protein [Streptomyces sp. WM6386]KKD04209.1 hypothetical protein TN53_30740 [Streptomyces sp. WM6386]